MYHEQEPFIFISYAHSDIETVLPLISKLEDNGFRIWFDNGIEAGSEWPEYIAEKILDCTVMLVLLSENALQSYNCKREINFAIDAKKELLVIHLEELQLSPGMKLQLNSLQAMFRFKFADDAQFLNALCSARLLQKCRTMKESEKKTTTPSAHSSSESLSDTKTNIYTAKSKKVRYGDIAELTDSEEIEEIQEAAKNEAVNENNINGTEIISEEKNIADTEILSVPTEKENTTEEEMRKNLSLLNESYSQKEETIKPDIKSVINKKSNVISENIGDRHRTITTELLIEAINYANANKNKELYSRFTLKDSLSEKRINNAISRYAKPANKNDVIAILDTTLFDSGKNGFLITPIALYSSESDIKVLRFNTIKSVSMNKKNHLEIVFTDGSVKDAYFSIFYIIIYHLLNFITGNISE